MISLTNVTKNYGKNKGISDFSYTFEKGNVYGLIGPNGAGKTTLLKCITNFIYKQVGTIKKDFKQPNTLKNIAYMPEFNFLIPGSVKNNIDFFTLTYNDTDKDILQSILDAFGIDLKHNVKNLSTGQSKALRFALTASRRTAVYLFDEPFSGLDVITRKKIVTQIIKSIPIEESCVIISSHELHDMDQLLDTVVVIDQSHLLTAKDVDAIKQDSQSLYDWFINQF
jgi:ABC-2 type transport system ATP-binding protein